MFEKMDMLLIAAKNRMVKAGEQLHEGFVNVIGDEEGADLVEMIIGMAIIAAVAVVVTKLIGGAIQKKAEDAADVITNAKF